MISTRARAPFLGALLLIAACGSSATITMPQDLQRTAYPANQPFRLTVILQSCSDSCAEYEEPTCEVSVDREERVIELDVSVSYDRVGDTCNERCGPPIFGHCAIGSLPPGTYTVKSGKFRRLITLE